MQYDRTVTITAYTAPGEILMINVAPLEWHHCDVADDCSVCVDLTADNQVIGIEVIERAKFDLAAVADKHGISDLVPEIEAAIAAAKPGP